MKILYITTVGLTMGFFKSIVQKLINDGNIVDIATNQDDFQVADCFKEWGCKVYQIDCSRSPLNGSNLKVIKQIRDIATEGEYDLVHCHTPVAAACTRMACRSLRKKGIKVVYTAHGFHFFKGSGLKNWLLFYPIERICSHWTDVLITINSEDYNLAIKKMKAKKIVYIPGVGIDTKQFYNACVDKSGKRLECGIPVDAFVVLSVGELNVNKNHRVVIDALNELKSNDIHYCIAGQGNQKEYLLNYAKSKNVEKNVHLLGYRKDVLELYKMADLYILPSLREGLNVSVMEAMASGLPCALSDIRGNTDLVKHNEGGFLCRKASDYARAISKMKSDADLRRQYAHINRHNSYLYDQNGINNRIIELYYGV